MSHRECALHALMTNPAAARHLDLLRIDQSVVAEVEVPRNQQQFTG